MLCFAKDSVLPVGQKSKLVLESTALNTFLTCATHALTLHMLCQSQNYYGTMD